jgi:hypothetical protein
MGGNPESEEFDDDDDVEEVSGDEQLDVDRAIKDLESTRRRSPRGGEPAWRRLEQRAEQKHTAELISDFEDYDIGEPRRPAKGPKGGASDRSKR